MTKSEWTEYINKRYKYCHNCKKLNIELDFDTDTWFEFCPIAKARGDINGDIYGIDKCPKGKWKKND